MKTFIKWYKKQSRIKLRSSRTKVGGPNTKKYPRRPRLLIFSLRIKYGQGIRSDWLGA